MEIGIEIYGSNRYNEILEEYGKVLSRFGLTRTKEGNANIIIECLGDLLNLHREIEEFIDESDKSIPYFGIMIKLYDDGTPYLEIKDSYD